LSAAEKARALPLLAGIFDLHWFEFTISIRADEENVIDYFTDLNPHGRSGQWLLPFAVSAASALAAAQAAGPAGRLLARRQRLLAFDRRRRRIGIRGRVRGGLRRVAQNSACRTAIPNP
jgi:hypothetical protein